MTTTKRTQQIKNRFTGAVLFECEIPDDIESGMAVRHALEKATAAKIVLSGAYLSGAYLSDADLSGAYLSGADLRGADLRDADLSGAYLSDAYLSDAYLSGAYLSGADLRDADGKQLPRATPEQAIENLDKVREIVMDNAKRLNMGHWHGADGWQERTCAEETLCGTTHCLAGWLQVCSTEPEIRSLSNPQLAGSLAAPIASKMFFRGQQEAMTWLETRAYVADTEERAKRDAERAARKAAQ